jgi:hypothetical protein
MIARLLLVTLLLAAPLRAIADEPGVDGAGPDEPGLSGSVTLPPPASAREVRIALGFGYSTLLVDPDVGEGYGGGVYLAYDFWKRLGVELSVFAAHNPYVGQLGAIGTAFVGGNITLGPSLRLTRPGSRFLVHADLAIGSYLIVPGLQENIWTLGLAGGLTVGLRLTSWLGLSLKPRYHLFNLANIAGPELRDLKALMKVGVIDRMEIPLCLSFFF